MLATVVTTNHPRAPADAATCRHRAVLPMPAGPRTASAPNSPPLGSAQSDRRAGQLQLPPHERGRIALEPRDALLVQRLALWARRHTEVAFQIRAQPPVPADRGVPVTFSQRRAHQLLMRRLVRPLDLDEAGPLPARPQELHVQRA